MQRNAGDNTGRARVAATHPVADEQLKAVSPILQVRRFDTSGWTETELIENLSDHTGLLVSMRTPLNTAVLEALAPELRVISSYTAGVENIDLAAADRLGIAVANTGSMIAIPTAEIAMLLIVAAMRQAGPSFELIRRGAWEGIWEHAPRGAEVHGKTLGIVGLGGVGAEVTRRAAAFGMTVLYHNRNALSADRAQGAEYVATLAELLHRADVVSLHCPLTEHTRAMINAQSLAQMKPGAVLVNTARGELLDEAAVIAALESGQLGAAGLDVYVGEPSVNPYFLSSDRVFTLPHIGTATPESRRSMERHALENLVRFFSGNPMRDVLVGGR